MYDGFVLREKVSHIDLHNRFILREKYYTRNEKKKPNRAGVGRMVMVKTIINGKVKRRERWILHMRIDERTECGKGKCQCCMVGAARPIIFTDMWLEAHVSVTRSVDWPKARQVANCYV